MMVARILWLSCVLGFSFTTQVGVARADEVARGADESDDAFMTRVMGGSAELAQKVVRTTELADGRPTLIGFVLGEDSDRMHLLVGHLLIETATNRFEHVQFPSCSEEGDLPVLMAVFFARTAKSGGRDLAVLCSWEIKHYQTEGTAYGAEFYRLKNSEGRFTVETIEKLNKKFNTANMTRVDDDGKRVREKAKFKTVADVKRILKRMGFPQ